MEASVANALAKAEEDGGSGAKYEVSSFLIRNLILRLSLSVA